MAITTENLIWDISVNSKNAAESMKMILGQLDSINKSLDKTAQNTTKTEKSLSGLGAGMVKLASTIQVAQVAWNLFGGSLKKIGGEFIDAEKANKQLMNSLAFTGNLTRESYKGFQDLADSIAAVTPYSDEQVKSLAAYSVSLGNTADTTKQMVKAAAGLSQGLGIGLDEAFQKLQGTLTGSAGSLGKLIPGFKNLTDQQLKNGEGIKAVSELYKDFANQGLTGTDGAIVKLSKGFNDLFETIGYTINQGAGWEGIINSVGEIIQSVTDHIKSHQKEWRQLAAAVASVVKMIVASVKILYNSVLTSINQLGQMLTSPFSTKWSKAFQTESMKAAEDGSAAIDELIDSFKNFGEVSETSGKTVESNLDAMVAKSQQVAASVKTAFGAGGPTKEFQDALKSILADNEKLRAQYDAIGMNEQETARIKRDAALEAISLKISELDLNKNITSEERDRLGNELAIQMSLTAQVADKETLFSLEKAQKDAIQGILESNEQLRISHLEGYEQIEATLALELQRLEIKRAQLEADGMLTGELGAQLAMAMELQKGAIQKDAQQKIDVEFGKEMDQLGVFAQAIGYSTRAMGDGINAGIDGFNDMFGTNIEGFSDAGIAAFATGAAKVADAIGTGVGYFVDAMGAVVSVFMKLFDPEFYNNLTGKLEKILNNLPNILKSAMEALLNAIGSLLDKGPEILDSVISAVEGFITKFMEMLPRIMQQLGDGLVKIVDSLTKMLPKMISGFMDALPGLIDKVFEAINMLVDRLPAIFQSFIEKIPQVLESLLSNLPKFITKIFDAIPQLISMIVRALPGIIDVIANNIGPIIEAFIEGVLGAIGEIIAVISDPVTITKIVVSIIKAIVQAIIGIVKGIIKGIGAFFKGLFKGAKMDGFDGQIKSIPAQLDKGFKKLAKNFTKESSELFNVADFGKGGGNKIKEEAQKFGEEISEMFSVAGNKVMGLWDYIKAGWDWLIEKLTLLFTWVWEKIFEPIIDGLQAVWQWVWDNVLGPIVDGVKEVWQWVYDTVVGPMIEGLSAVWTWVYDNVIGPIAETIGQAWDGIVDFFKNIFSGKIKEAFSGIIDTFKNMGETIWEGLKNGFNSAGDLFSGIGTKIWDGLKKGLDGLGDFFKNLFDKLNPKNLFEKLFKLPDSAWKKGTVEETLNIDIPFVKFAKGTNRVPGQAATSGDSEMNDRVLAFLSPGEAVIPRSKMSNPIYAAIVDSILSGSLNVPGFSFGGKILSGDFSGAMSDVKNLSASQVYEEIQNAGKMLDPSQMWAMVKEKTFDAIMKIFDANKFHSGGLVPATLQSNEFIMRRSAVQSYGTDTMNAINDGTAQLGGTQNFTFNIEMKIDASSSSLDESYVRTKLIPEMKKELKRASFNGEIVLSQRGVDPK